MIVLQIKNKEAPKPVRYRIMMFVISCGRNIVVVSKAINVRVRHLESNDE